MPTPAHAPAAAETLTVRPVTYEDLTEGSEVFTIRNHARDLTLDRAHIAKVEDTNVYPRTGHSSGRRDHEAAPVGIKRTATVPNVYGSEHTVHLYDGPEALDADYPDIDDSAHAADRQRALGRQQDPEVYIEDPYGDVTLPLTPDWGSSVYLSMVVPDLDPKEVLTTLKQMLDERFPGHRTMKVQARPAADRRVNVYRQDYGVGVRNRDTNEPLRTPLAFNVLEVEGFPIGGSGCLIVQTGPDTPTPIIGE